MTQRRLYSLDDILWEAAKKTGLAKKISLYELVELRKASHGFAPAGRTIIEMDTVEYERVRDALGQQWEYRGDVRIVEGPSVYEDEP